MNKEKPAWFVGITVAISRLVNAILGGWSGEMLSARAWRNRRNEFWGVVVITLDACFFWQVDHCQQCYQWERNNADRPE